MIIDTTKTQVERAVNLADIQEHANSSDLIGSEVVHKYEDKWWFYHEGWERMGPYETKKGANEACNEYARLLYAWLGEQRRTRKLLKEHSGHHT